MSNAAREMTLAEWVDTLPECHAARKELARLTADRDALAEECRAWREWTRLDWDASDGEAQRVAAESARLAIQVVRAKVDASGALERAGKA